MIMVNGNTWPFLTVEQRRYRFRFLNGCQSRFLILDFSDIPGVEVWQIGNEGGFLPAPVNLTADNGNRLLMGLAERADVIVDFTNVPQWATTSSATSARTSRSAAASRTRTSTSPTRTTTGQIMQFRVGAGAGARPDDAAAVPGAAGRSRRCPPETITRPLALLEMMSEVLRGRDRPRPCSARSMPTATPDAPGCGRMPVTENPDVGDTEIWEFYNFTADAHPMHVHEVAFEVVDRQALVVERRRRDRSARSTRRRSATARAWETGFKDTVIAYPGEVTRIRAQVRHARASSSGTATSSSTRTTR